MSGGPVKKRGTVWRFSLVFKTFLTLFVYQDMEGGKEKGDTKRGGSHEAGGREHLEGLGPLKER